MILVHNLSGVLFTSKHSCVTSPVKTFPGEIFLYPVNASSLILTGISFLALVLE